MSTSTDESTGNRFVPVTQRELFKKRKKTIAAVFRKTRSIGITSRIMNVTSYLEIYNAVSAAKLMPAPFKPGPISYMEHAQIAEIPKQILEALSIRKLSVRKYLRLLSARFEVTVHECDLAFQLIKGMDDQIAQDFPEAYEEAFQEKPHKRGRIAPAYAGDIKLKNYKTHYLCLVPRYRIISAGKTEIAARRHAMKLVVLAAQTERGQNYLNGITGEKNPAGYQ